MYAKGTITNPVTKKIELYDIRPSTASDEEGRVKIVILELKIKSLSLETAQYDPVIPQDQLEIISTLLPQGTHRMAIDKIYNSDGSVHTTIKEWTKSLSAHFSLDDDKTGISGIEKFENKYILIQGRLIGISGLKYKIGISEISEKIEIHSNGNACLYVRNHDDSVDTLITDVDLKDIQFEKGIVEKE